MISIGTNAYKDIMSVSHRRNPYVQMIVCDARAQGENARELIVQGIRRLDRMGVDTIIIGRGGGSREDLEVLTMRQLSVQSMRRRRRSYLELA